MTAQRKRLVLGKLGLDGHDNGLRIVTKWLVGAGYEVVYAGLYNSTQRIVQMAIEEDVSGIGISFLEFGHVYYTEKLMGELKSNDLGHMRVFVGGVIPPEDVLKLKAMGVNAVFTPGTSRAEILDVINSVMR